MKTVIITISSLIVLAAATMIATAAQNMGGEAFKLDGGSRGYINFPHRQHQDTIGDCKVCHDAFPMEYGVIMKLKSQGELKKKKIMKAQCLGCHKQYKKAGKKYGPVKCSQCHNR